MKSGSGEFCITESFGEQHRTICFYKTHNGFYKDVNFKLPNEENLRWVNKEITRDEYLKKLKHFLYLVKNEVINEA